MTSAAAPDTAVQEVFGGVDSHADTVHAAVISDNGGHLADAEFTTTAGTSSYGAGFTRAAISHGQHVVEVNRPDRPDRARGRSRGRRGRGSCNPSTPSPVS
jgi:hypothetical protein